MEVRQTSEPENGSRDMNEHMSEHMNEHWRKPWEPILNGQTGASGPESGGTETVERTGIRTRSKPKIKRPSFYVVVVHNDPITPRTFVVEVLKRYFNKGEPEATRIMMLAHNFGVGVVGKFTHEIAESKAKQVNQYAREAGYPLLFSVEEE